ncbi:MAG: VCBS repeat-containing protein, partial [Deltaproteobacteria bacterium]|nr:VCBS repeat-containing protein [Deltaproteobacteria bacterium]
MGRFHKASTCLLLGAVFFLFVGLQQGPHHEPTGLVPHAIAIGDFNGDGVPDVAVPAAAERKVTILLSDGRGGFAANHSYPTGIGPSWVEVGDWNGDG